MAIKKQCTGPCGRKRDIKFFGAKQSKCKDCRREIDAARRAAKTAKKVIDTAREKIVEARQKPAKVSWLKPLDHKLVTVGDESSITVYIPGEVLPKVAHSSHPAFKQIVEKTRKGDPSVAELFDVAATASKKFQRISERVTHRNGRLYLDGDEIDDAVSQQILRFIEEGRDDYAPLVNFFEKVQSNPTEHSRKQLYSWLKGHRFTITRDGDIVGYKGVDRDEKHGYVSSWSGEAIVDGEIHNGHIPNPIGSVVEMPRSSVVHDPASACSTGLHVATWGFAERFATVPLEVHVNPRDVVSVPNHHADKMRVCRYRVIGVVDKPHEGASL